MSVRSRCFASRVDVDRININIVLYVQKGLNFKFQLLYYVIDISHFFLIFQHHITVSEKHIVMQFLFVII